MERTLEGLEGTLVVALNADGSRTVVCPDGTKVTFEAGYFRSSAPASAEPEEPKAGVAAAASLAA